MKNMEKKVIMLLPPTVFPIPAVGGGAVEQLITHLLDVNETEQRASFVVVSKYDRSAAERKYVHSDVLYLDEDGFVTGYRKRFRFLWMLYCLWLKIFHNHIAERLSGRHHTRMDTYSFQCALLAKLKGVDMVVNELHDFGKDAPMTVFNSIVGPERFFNHIHSVREENLASRRIMNNSISISEYVRDHWVVDRSIPGTHEVLYNCIDVDRFDKAIPPDERRQRRKALGIEDTDFAVIFCGRLIPIKGVEELLTAFEALEEKKKTNIKLLLIGSAAFSNGNNTDFAVRITERAKKSANVIPIGYVPNSELPLYYALADAQVVPSTCQEGAGLVAIEGMAAGLPLIITKSGGMPEYAAAEASVQLPIDAQLSVNLMETIEKLADDPALCGKLGRAGKKHAKNFSREAYYTGFLDIAERACGK